ncbi:MAG TPA: SprT-like domain-containing protein [Gemmatimonadaceae bacterium]|nr:SprT-like domain-containing protein [Gemmatimonadaceae bacterium]
MLRALGRLIGLGAQLQLPLELESPPQSADDLRRVFLSLGLDRRYGVRLTQNRTVVVSFTSDEVRIHRGFLEAPDTVLRAVVDFVQARTRRKRAEARRDLLAYKIPSHARAEPGPRRALEKTHPADEKYVDKLKERHAQLNSEKFSGALRPVPIRVSRRLKSRLGHYAWSGQEGRPAEIVISRSHIRRHGWDEAEHTLLHEMVHQWQDETGRKVDHGREFRQMARAVGITPHARRDVA